VTPVGIEPTSSESESEILSIVLRSQDNQPQKYINGFNGQWRGDSLANIEMNLVVYIGLIDVFSN
jgi:hypothetical protein